LLFVYHTKKWSAISSNLEFSFMSVQQSYYIGHGIYAKELLLLFFYYLSTYLFLEILIWKRNILQDNWQV